jgi:hypothetical protein
VYAICSPRPTFGSNPLDGLRVIIKNGIFADQTGEWAQ